MKRIYLYIFIVPFIILVGSCSRLDTEEPGNEVSGEEIKLESSLPASVDINTRAVSDFPNNGSIGILAAEVYDPENPSQNWTGYDDINNAEAVASSESNNVYSFTWTTQKYWPFDGSNLYFMAYSPIADGSLNYYLLSDNNSSLTIGLDSNMPDVMYASGNTDPQPFNKTNGTVQLGEFRHLLSKLTVRVVADPDMDETIEVYNLTVSTNSRSASFPLYSGDDGLTVIPAPQEYVATLIQDNIHFKTQPFSKTIFLFPGTEDDVKISIGLVDTSNSNEYSTSFMMSYFVDPSGAEVTLERAKNTVLTINVVNVGIQNPDRNIQLEGTIKDWDFRGDFQIDIN